MLVAIVFSLLSAGIAAAQSVPKGGSQERAEHDSKRRWIPSLALQTGFLAEQRQGESETVERGMQSGDSSFLFGHFGASVGLATPELPWMPIPTRFFVRADVSGSVDEKESLATESNPGNPLLDVGANLEGGPVDGILGTGTTLRVQAEPLILSGGTGFSFETRVGDRAVRIKPSAEWMYQRDELALRFADIESVGPNPDVCQPCRATSIDVQTTKGFHSVGPGIEVDVDAGRAGAFSFSVFTQFRALRILGDREAALEGTGSWFTRTVDRVDGQTVITSISPDTSRADTTATARYRREPWSYFAAAGVRIFWDPE